MAERALKCLQIISRLRSGCLLQLPPVICSKEAVGRRSDMKTWRSMDAQLDTSLMLQIQYKLQRCFEARKVFSELSAAMKFELQKVLFLFLI